MAYSDPFSFTIDAVWDALEANSDFTDLVPTQNRIKLDSGFKPFKSTLMESSVPEVQILPGGKRFEENPCSGLSIVQILNIALSTGVRNTSKLLPLEWRIIQAIYTAINQSSGHFASLSWQSTEIIKSVLFQPLDEGLTYDELSRELKGWAAIMPIEVKLHLPNGLLGLE